MTDRLIQQALLQVLQPILDPTFSEHSYGFRPGRSAHDAVLAAQSYVQSGRRIVVDVDLEKFFDRVNHDILIDRLQKRIGDAGVIRLIRAYLNSGIMDDGVVQKRTMGTPQGGPLSPLLANVLLDEVDKELERRGHCFVRYADDANVYVRSRRAGERVMALLRRLYGKLRLTVNETKSAVASVFGRKFLGYGFWAGPGGVIKRKVADKPMRTFKQRIRQLTRRSPAGAVCRMWWIVCGPISGDGRRTSGWRKHHGSGESWTSGCVIGCAPSSSSSGSAARPSTGNCWHWEPSLTWRAQVAANSRRWWRNSGMLLNAVLTLKWSDRLGLPRLS